MTEQPQNPFEAYYQQIQERQQRYNTNVQIDNQLVSEGIIDDLIDAALERTRGTYGTDMEARQAAAQFLFRAFAVCAADNFIDEQEAKLSHVMDVVMNMGMIGQHVATISNALLAMSVAEGMVARYGLTMAGEDVEEGEQTASAPSKDWRKHFPGMGPSDENGG